MSEHRYFVLHKPPNMVSQFISPDDVGLLGDIDFRFPEGTHAIGRLDKDSEGLLLLTTNKKVTKLLFQGAVPHRRDYLVLVKNAVNEETLKTLQTGVTFQTFGGVDYNTRACQVSIVTNPEECFHIETNMRPDIAHTWLLIGLTEGKYHQVRKMVAAVHHRCRRLIRVAIEDIQLGQLASGKVLELDEATFFRLLKIDDYAR
ncbi:MAG: pseudouridine synthase [Phycisphaerales bacterium]|nr:pseudouridine synthase [Phycisphaerales bacterium]